MPHANFNKLGVSFYNQRRLDGCNEIKLWVLEDHQQVAKEAMNSALDRLSIDRLVFGINQLGRE